MKKLYRIPYAKNYLIDKQGNVFSKTSNKYLKQYTTGRGYVYFIIWDNEGNKRSYFRHRLLCSIFKPVDNWEMLSVDHINGVRGDDRLENIEFITIKENIQRYHTSKYEKRDIRYPVVIKYLKTNIIYTCDNHLHAAKLLKVHRYEILRRLNMNFGSVFKDYTQIKWGHDERDFPEIKDIEEARENTSHLQKIKMFNHITKEIKHFDKVKDACDFLNITPAGLVSRLRNRVNKIYPNGWEVKYKHDKSPWSKPSIDFLTKVATGCWCNRPIIIKNINTNEELIFNTCREACRYFGNCTPTKIWYRLKVYKDKPSKDGYIYNYLTN